MKSIPIRFAPAVVAVTVAVGACLAAATVVQAQTSGPARAPAGAPPGEARPPLPPGEHGMHGGPMMHMMREVERLRTSLQLNAQQAALWDRAVAAMKPQGDPRAEMKAQHDRLAAMLDDPNFDPRKLAAETDRQAAERRAKMANVRDAWFAVYDSLNPVQRGQVREFLRERMSHRPHGMHGMHGGPMGPWHHDGPQPPMAPPAPPAPGR